MSQQDTGILLLENTSDTTSHYNEAISLRQAIKRYPRVVGFCFSLTFAIVGWGYDLVVVESITGVEAFLEDYGELYEGKMLIPAIWLSLWLASDAIGATFGSIAAGFIQDGFGRRVSLIVASAISGVGVTIIFSSGLAPDIDGRRIVFFIGKIIQGISIGLLETTAITRVSETAPTSLRAPALALFPTFTLVGQLMGLFVLLGVSKVASDAGYRAALGSQWLFALLPFIAAWMMPESLAYLARKGLHDEARIAATKLYQCRATELEALEHIQLVMKQEEETFTEISYLACFSNPHIRRTSIVILANLMPAFFGLQLISTAVYFLQTLGMSADSSSYILVGGILAGLLFSGLAIWILSRAGRRRMTLISMSVASLLWGSMGVAGFWNGLVTQYYSGVVLVAVIGVCGLGSWPASYAVMGETSSVRLRAKTSGVGAVAQQLSSIAMNFVLPYLFNPDAANLGAKVGWLYCGLCTIAVAICWLWLPEMKGRSADQIDWLFHRHIPTRGFQSCVDEDLPGRSRGSSTENCVQFLNQSSILKLRDVRK